jgi:hypothetical protein
MKSIKAHAEPPRRLVIRWQNQFKPELKFIAAVSGGWPKVISNLKSLLETGSAVLQDPYPFRAPILERNKYVYEPLQRVKPCPGDVCQ